MLKTKKRTAGAMISALLLIVILGIIGLRIFNYYTISNNKNTIDQITSDIRVLLDSTAGEVDNGANLTLNTTSILSQLNNISKFTNATIVLDKDVPIDTLSGYNVLGTALSPIIDANGALANKYLVIRTNTDFSSGGIQVDGFVLGDTANTPPVAFDGTQSSADKAGFTYQSMAFLVPSADKALMQKLQDASPAKIVSIVDTTITDGTNTPAVEIVKVNVK